MECRATVDVQVDDELLQKVLQVTGCNSASEAVEFGLRLLLQMSAQEELRQLRGAFMWEGDLDSMRTDK